MLDPSCKLASSGAETYILLDWQIPAAFLMAWPQLMFILATNIQTKSAVIKLCANSAVVVTLSNLIDVLLVQRMSSWLVKIHQHGVVANPVRVNQLKAESQYILLVYSNLVFPVLAQFLLDVSAPRITCLYCGTQLFLYRRIACDITCISATTFTS